jgi:hypothetical protein
VLAVTDTVDDERPLWVEVETGQHERPWPRRVVRVGGDLPAPWASAGAYIVRPCLLDEAARCIAAGAMALRRLLEHAVALPGGTWAVPIGPAADVDRPQDVCAAGAFVSTMRSVS